LGSFRGLIALPGTPGMIQFIFMTDGVTAGMILTGGSGKGMNMIAEGQIKIFDRPGHTGIWNTE